MNEIIAVMREPDAPAIVSEIWIANKLRGPGHLRAPEDIRSALRSFVAEGRLIDGSGGYRFAWPLREGSINPQALRKSW